MPNGGCRYHSWPTALMRATPLQRLLDRGVTPIWPRLPGPGVAEVRAGLATPRRRARRCHPGAPAPIIAVG
ncbi:MAG: hypothetical protein U5N10_10135 [Gemmobacter sp.]|nr:hypothetical protein [Gemmobacter sp.]